MPAVSSPARTGKTRAITHLGKKNSDTAVRLGGWTRRERQRKATGHSVVVGQRPRDPTSTSGTRHPSSSCPPLPTSGGRQRADLPSSASWSGHPSWSGLGSHAGSRPRTGEARVIARTFTGAGTSCRVGGRSMTRMLNSRAWPLSRSRPPTMRPSSPSRTCSPPTTRSHRATVRFASPANPASGCAYSWTYAKSPTRRLVDRVREGPCRTHSARTLVVPGVSAAAAKQGFDQAWLLMGEIMAAVGTVPAVLRRPPPKSSRTEGTWQAPSRSAPQPPACAAEAAPTPLPGTDTPPSSTRHRTSLRASAVHPSPRTPALRPAQRPRTRPELLKPN